MDIIIKSTISVGKNVDKRELSWTFGWNKDWCIYYGKWYGGSQKFKNRTANDPVIPVLGIYTKTLYQKKYMHLHLVFTIAMIWKQYIAFFKSCGDRWIGKK